MEQIQPRQGIRRDSFEDPWLMATMHTLCTFLRIFRRSADSFLFMSSGRSYTTTLVLFVFGLPCMAELWVWENGWRPSSVCLSKDDHELELAQTDGGGPRRTRPVR